MTIVFGPLLPVLYFSSSRPLQLQARLEELHRQFYYANSLVVIPNLIAAIVYLRQNPPLYEVTYIYYLATMQLLSLLGSCLSGIVFLDPTKEETGVLRDDESARREPDARASDIAKFRLAAIVGSILAFGLYMGSVGWARQASLSLFDVQSLRTACSAYGTLIPDIPSPPPAVAPSHPSSELGALLPASQVARELGIAFGVAVAALLACLVLFYLSSAIESLIKGLFMAFLFVLVFPWANSLLCLGFVAGMLFSLGHMQANRTAIKTLAGPEFEDNKWGFGQVVALFIWIPSSVNVVYWFLRLLVWHLRHRELPSLR